jgi:hypothetical protein
MTVQLNVTVAVSTDHEQTMNVSFSFLWHHFLWQLGFLRYQQCGMSF